MPSCLVVMGLLSLTSLGCTPNGYQELQGGTMGTQYRVSARCPVGFDILRTTIEKELEAVNNETSTYQTDSELSQFNVAPAAEWFDVTDTLVKVIETAAAVSEASAGAFDVTVGPLVNLWGFGVDAVPNSVPSDAAIDAALAKTGWRKISWRKRPPALWKSADVYVDLSAIAKGHGVDRISDKLVYLGCTDFMVDIGGEVRARGRNPRGAPWRIGIEEPNPDAFGAVRRVVNLDNMALATSGDYRNFIDLAGTRYSHTIDPRSGRPVQHKLAAVTVAHPSAMWADGYATALNVLGPEAGWELATKLELAALFITRADNGFEDRYTEHFVPLLPD